MDAPALSDADRYGVRSWPGKAFHYGEYVVSDIKHPVDTHASLRPGPFAKGAAEIVVRPSPAYGW
jgi:hypothetical protein